MALIPKPVGGKNLSDPLTLQFERLSLEEARERLRILSLAQDALQQTGKDLTPRSQRELKELSQVFQKDDIQGTVIINRRENIQWYKVVFSETPQERALQVFRDADEKLKALSKNIPVGSQQAIISNIVKPSTGMAWYRDATENQMTAVFRADFMFGLKQSYIANLSLLSAAGHLSRKADVYAEILTLYTDSTALYQDQVSFNRACELEILGYSEVTLSKLEKMRDAVLACGPKLDTMPVGFLDQTNRMLKSEEERGGKLFEAVQKHCSTFIARISALEEGIQKCLKLVTSEAKAVQELMAGFRDLAKQKEELSQKKAEVQTKYQAFQDAKAKEYGSRKVEVKKSSFWIIEWSSTEVVEADFGSKELYNQFLAIQKESENLDKRLKEASEKLASQLKQHAPGFPPEELHLAANALAAALLAVSQLKIAVKEKKDQSEKQLSFIQERLAKLDAGQNEIQNIFDAIGVLNLLSQRIVCGHAIWVQSHLQCHTIQVIRSDENNRALLIKDDITYGRNQQLRILDNNLNVLARGDQPEVNKLLDRATISDLLEEIK
jgi:hypothetical protein